MVQGMKKGGKSFTDSCTEFLSSLKHPDNQVEWVQRDAPAYIERVVVAVYANRSFEDIKYGIIFERKFVARRIAEDLKKLGI